MKLLRDITCLLLSVFMALPMMAGNQSAQQSRVVSGVVSDENSEPVTGASVSVPGTTIGTVTDLNGKFSLSNVPANQKTIQISFLGYKTQTVDVAGKTEVNVKLAPSDSELDEVVVVGYGIQKKAHMTGAIATVAPKELTDLSVTSLGSSLRGLVTGLSVSGGDGRPGEGSRLNIRQNDISAGYSPNGGSTSPLYVIDDYIYPQETGEAAFNNLDANMIESITVLKDAAAAVYGARSSRGVILVKTKRGQVGAPKISYSGQFGYVDEVARIKMLNAYDYGTIWNGVRAARTSDNTIDRTRDLFQADELEAMKSLNYDLLDDYWSSALTQKHSVNMSGGSERANYFAGISYIMQDGNLGRIDYDRWNYRAGVDAKITSSLKASLQVSGDFGDQNTALNKIGRTSTEADYYTLLSHPRYIPDYVAGHPMVTYGLSNQKIDANQHYNFDAVQNMDNYSDNTWNNMTINASLEYDFNWSNILKGLKLKVSYSKSINDTKNNQLGTNITVYKMLNRGGSGQHLYTGEGIDLSDSNFSAITESNGNSIRRYMTTANNYQLNFIATYARTFGLHDVSGLFTIEKAEREYEDLEGAVLEPLSFTNGQSKSAKGTQSTNFGRSESGMLSYVGRINYSYANKYLLEFLIRSDASTKFPSGNYWGVFPSVSAGWTISEESWFHNNVKWVDFLKLRASYGLLGKDNIAAWAWLQSYNRDANRGAVFGTTPTNNIGAGISSSDAPNPDPHWDKTYQTNVGIDAYFLKNRLSVNLDGYYYKNRDVFMTRDGAANFPATVGTKPTAENFGAIDTYGVELSLGWKDKIGENFKYHVKLNTGYNDSKMITMAWPNQIPIYAQHPNQRTDLGEWGLECIGMFRSYQEVYEYFDKYLKKDDGTYGTYLGNNRDNVHPGMLIYRDVRGPQNPDGTYQDPDHTVDKENDLVKISNRNNPYGFSLNLGGEWKSFSFSAQIGANWGGYSFVPKTARVIQNFVSSSGGYNDLQYVSLPSFWANNMFVYEDVLDGQENVVARQNLDAEYPNLRYSLNGETSTFWKVSGTRVELRNITLAYSLPKTLIKKIGIESCRLNLTGQNMLSFYNPYPDNFMDPMSGTYGNYPILRKLTLGLNVSF